MLDLLGCCYAPAPDRRIRWMLSLRRASASMLLETSQIFDILLPLPRSAFVTGLVLGTSQAMRTATAKRRGIQVAAAVADRILDVAAVLLERFQAPRLAGGIGEERAEFGAILTSAGKRGGPRPIAERRKRFSDAGTQMDCASGTTASSRRVRRGYWPVQ